MVLPDEYYSRILDADISSEWEAGMLGLSFNNSRKVGNLKFCFRQRISTTHFVLFLMELSTVTTSSTALFEGAYDPVWL